VPVAELKPSMVNSVNGFVEGLKPLVPLFQVWFVVAKVPVNVPVRMLIVIPELFSMRNCTGLWPKLGSVALSRLDVVKLKGLLPLHVTAPPQGAAGLIVNSGAAQHGALSIASDIAAP